MRTQAAWAAAEEEQRRVLRAHGPELSIDALGDMHALQANMTGAQLHPVQACAMPYSWVGPLTAWLT
jgi:hypothetical protein